jgi:hypothetical protein
MSSLADELNAMPGAAEAPDGPRDIFVKPRAPMVIPPMTTFPDAAAAAQGSIADELNAMPNGPPVQPAALPLPPQSWADWLHENAITKPSTAAGSDWYKAGVDDVTMGAGAYPISWLTGRPVHDIRQEFEKSQNALGPIAGSALNAATYAVPGMGLGKAANMAKGAWKLGGLGTSMLEGTMAGIADRAGHGDTDPLHYGESALGGSAGGAGGHFIGEGIINPITRKIGDWWKGLPGRSGDTQFAAERDAFSRGDKEGLQDAVQRAKDEKAAIALQATRRGQPTFTPAQQAQNARWNALQDVASRSAEPGLLAKGAGGLAGTGLGVLGAQFLPHGVTDVVGSLGSLALGAAGFGGGSYGLSKLSPARAINSWDRNVQGQRALDALYQAGVGKPVTTNTWPDLWHQFGVGAGTGATRP